MADELKCKYCGRKFVGGFPCQNSPTKKHVALANGKDCVFCGRKFVAGFPCTDSPSKKHQLDT